MDQDLAAPAREVADDPLKGIGTYRLVRALCLSPLLAYAALLLLMAGAPLGDFLYIVMLVSAVVTPFLALAGLVIAIVAGVRDKLSPTVNDKMWRLVLIAIGGYVLLYAVAQ